MSNESAGGGIGCGVVLGIVFIVLKLCGVIDWPWIWVLAPFWIPWVILLLIIGGMFLVGYFYIRSKK